MDGRDFEEDAFRTPAGSEGDIFRETQRHKSPVKKSQIHPDDVARSESAASIRSNLTIDGETAEQQENGSPTANNKMAIEASPPVAKLPRLKNPGSESAAKTIAEVWHDDVAASNAQDYEEEITKKEPVHIFAAVMHFCNTVLGTGMLSLPHAVLIAGAIPGGLLLLLLALLVDWTVMLLIDAAKKQNVLTYEDLAKKVFGTYFRNIITVTQLLFAFGGMCAYLVIIADTVNSILGIERGTRLANRYRAISMWLSGLFLVVLSLPKNNSLLSTLATFGFSAIMLLTGALFVCSVQHEGKGFQLWEGAHPFRSIGIISFVYVCHHGTFKVYRAHGAPAIEHFARTTHYSMLVSAIVCIVFAICGYLAFGDRTEGNILNNLDYKSHPILLTFAHACVLASISSTFPLECSVARDVVSYYIPELRKPHKAFLTTLLLFVIAALISSLTDNLASVLALTGSVSANFLAYVFPPMISLRLQPDERKLLCYTSIFFGVVASVLAVL